MNEATGRFTALCESWLSVETGGHAILVPNCTSALEASVMLAGVGSGDEVILPSFAYPTCASAVIRAGGTPVFVDIKPDTLNLDPEKVREAITPQTVAIMTIGYAGVMERMDTSIRVIEDAAQCIGEYRLGGDFGAISFHHTKNVGVGEGGALLVSSEYLERARMLCACGTDRYKNRKNWDWRMVGSSYIMSELLAEQLHPRLLEVSRINAERRRVWQIYHDHILTPWKATRPGNGHIFWLMADNRDEIIAALPHIPLVKHFSALHATEPGRRYGRAAGECKTSLKAAAQILRPPMNVSADEAFQIAQSINRYLITERRAA